MANVSVAICESFDGPVAGFGDGPAECAGILLNRIKRSVRVPGRGLNFDVVFRDCRREDLDNELCLEFHVGERDLNAVLDAGGLDLIGACRRWLEEHGTEASGASPRVLPARYFESAQPRRLAA